MCQLTIGAGRGHLMTSPRPHRYLMSRGLTEDQATSMIVAGFIEPIVKELPMEYAVEMNRLIEINMAAAGAVG
jgi:Fe-S cluster assembly protein SufB